MARSYGQQLLGPMAASIAAAAMATASLFFISPRAAEQTGLHRQVFPDVGFNGAPLLDDTETAITLDFLNDDPDLPRRFFSARWSGFWHLPEAGKVELHGAGDDRLDVWLDGALVIRRAPPADMHTLVRTVRLEPGIHELRVQYEQHGGAFNMRLEWAPPGGRALPFAAHRLFRERPDAEDIRLAYGAMWLERVVAALWFAVFGIALVWLAALAWPRFGPRSAYRHYWERGFHVGIAGPFGLRAPRSAGTLRRASGLPARDAEDHAPPGLKRTPAQVAVTILLGLLFLGHVGVFGWRAITFERRLTGDSLNYIDVARNVSAGEGLVQSAVGFNQPTFWDRDFSPDFPDKTRASHNPGYSALIAAVAAVTGLEHTAAALAIGATAYAGAVVFAFLFASRLAGIGAGLLAAAFLAHQLRSIFLRAWTEPVALALLLAMLALLARSATPRRVAAAGLVAGLALLVRNSMLPLLALGGLACLLSGGGRRRRLLLFGAGASIALVGPFLGEGHVYPPQAIIAASEFPRQELSKVLVDLLRHMRWDLAVLALLAGCAWWRAVRDGQPIVSNRARMAVLLAAAWVTGWCVVLVGAQLATVTDPLGDRLLAPVRAVTAIASALLLWRACCDRLRMAVAVGAFAAMMAVAIAGDAIILGTNDLAERLYTSSATILMGRDYTGRMLSPDGDPSDFDRSLRSPRRRWIARNVTSRDFVTGAGTVDLPYHLRQQVPATVSFSASPYTASISGAKFDAIFLARCGRYDNLYLILSKLPRGWGQFALDLAAGAPVQPGTPAANFLRVADLPESVIFRFTGCEG